jgi:hypothetical protein
MRELNKMERLILLTLFVSGGRLDWEKIGWAVFILLKNLQEPEKEK